MIIIEHAANSIISYPEIRQSKMAQPENFCILVMMVGNLMLDIKFSCICLCYVIKHTAQDCLWSLTIFVTVTSTKTTCPDM